MNVRAQQFIIAVRAATCNFLLAIVSGAPFSGQADSVVLPKQAENTPGNQAWDWGAGIDARWQQVFNAEVLVSAMPNGAWITGLAFRSDAGNATISFDSLGVRMSTTAVRAGPLERAFARNTGADETLVYAANGVRWVLTGVGSFSAVVPFSTPFFYNPARGNLLMDVTFINPSAHVTVDADRSQGVDMIWARGVPIPIQGEGGAQGVVTRIDFNPIPEPSTMVTLSAGVAILVAAWIRGCGRATVSL
jgi:hypothetical protein